MLDRRVWEPALKDTCARYGIFEGTYQVQSMSVDKLQRAAVGPWLLYNKISKCAETDNPLPLRKRHCVKWEDSDRLPIKDLRLVPGGRYLIGKVGAWSSHAIHVWDLGTPVPWTHSEHVLRPRLLHLEKGERMDIVDVSHESNKLRILTERKYEALTAADSGKRCVIQTPSRNSSLSWYAYYLASIYSK